MIWFHVYLHWIQGLEKHKNTQRSTKYIKRLRKQVHHCELLELAAILDDILDFEK